MQNVTLVRPEPNEPREVVQVADYGNRDFDVAFDMPPRASSPSPPPPPQQPQQQPPPPPPQRPPPQRQPQSLRPEELTEFANPNKLESPMEDLEEDQQSEDVPNFEEDYQEYEYPQQYHQAPQQQPLPPFATLEDERADLMFKLQRASRNGIHVRQFSYTADIRDLRTEVAKAKAEQDVNASVAFQRQILMTVCSGLEFANRKWAYFDLELDGWSESVMEDMDKFTPIFERLHAKHAGRINNIPPELSLVLMIGGSAMTWHLTKTMLKPRAPPPVRKRRLSSSSESDSSEEDELSNRRRRKERRKYSRQQPKQREMKGPGFDVGGLGGLGGFPPIPIPDLMPRMTREQSTVVEDVTEQQSAEEEEEDNDSERLSDIPSEDLDNVPSNLHSPEQDTNEKVIDLPQDPPKKKRGPKKANKNVIVL